VHISFYLANVSDYLLFCHLSHATLGLFKKLQQRAPKSLRRYFF
jgi:hypothetical protein